MESRHLIGRCVAHGSKYSYVVVANTAYIASINQIKSVEKIFIPYERTASWTRNQPLGLMQ